MTNNEIINTTVIANAIPLAGISGPALSDIILLQLDLQRATDSFYSRIREAVAKIKTEKYPSYDSEAAKPEAERAADFAEWEKELNATAALLMAEEGAKEHDGKAPGLTRRAFEALCAGGVDGAVTLPGCTEEGRPNRLPRLALIRILAGIVEEK